MLNERQSKCMNELQEFESKLHQDLEKQDATNQKTLQTTQKNLPVLLKAEIELRDKIGEARLKHSPRTLRDLQDDLKEVLLVAQVIQIELEQKKAQLANEKVKFIKNEMVNMPLIVEKYFGRNSHDGALTNISGSMNEFNSKFDQFRQQVGYMLTIATQKEREAKDNADKAVLVYQKMQRQFMRVEDLTIR